MACPSETTLLEHVEATLAPIEAAMVRDHVLACPRCARRADEYRRLNRELAHPDLIEPPTIILQNVMKRLYPEMPTIPSVIALIAASLVFLVSWIYITFDFAHNSLVQAFQLAQGSTAGWVGGIVRIISTAFSFVYASFKAINAFGTVVFRVHVGVPVVAGIMLTLSLAFFVLLFRLFSHYLKAEGK